MKTMTRDEYNQSGHGALWWIARIIGMAIVFGTIAVLLWRVFSSGDPKEITRMTPNQPLSEAYAAAEAEGRELTVYWNELPKLTYTHDKNYGYFAVTKGLFIEEAQQVQLIFRYNNSTIRHLKEDYHLDEMPSRDEDLYDVTLLVAYDLTPDDPSDNDGNDPASVRFVRYQPESATSAQKNLYNYRRLTFDGVDMTVTENPVLAVYVDVYYKGAVDYDAEPYGTLIIYDYAAKREPYELTKADREAIEGFVP